MNNEQAMWKSIFILAGIFLTTCGNVLACPFPSNVRIEPDLTCVGTTSQVKYDSNEGDPRFKIISTTAKTEVVTPASGYRISPDGWTVTWDEPGIYTVKMTVSITSKYGATEITKEASATKTVKVCEVEITGSDFIKVYCNDSAPDINLAATTSETGGTFAWEIDQGRDKVRLMGPTTKSTIRVKGEKLSMANNDVTIKVIWRKDGAQCEAIHTLTVQKPTRVTHEDLVFFYREGKIGKIVVATTIGCEAFVGTLFDQLGNTMADVPYSEFVIINILKSVPHAHWPVPPTGRGNTSEGGQFTDMFAVVVVGEPPSDMSVIAYQSVTFGGCIGRHTITITKNSITDGYPILLGE